MKKKLLALVAVLTLVLTSVFGLTACGGEKDNRPVVKVGYTQNPPMNYSDNSGKLIGFDTELTEAVFNKLGYRVVFTEIEWSNKFTDLKSKNIDCIWNGFTANCDDNGVARTDVVDISYYYMTNKQAVVAKKGTFDVNSIDLATSFKDKKGTFENGSAAEGMMSTFANAITKGAKKQIDCLNEVKSNAQDFAVIDYITAKENVGKGTYSELVILDTVSEQLPAEKYAVAFRKGDKDLQTKVNNVLVELAKEGKIKEIAQKYSLSDKIIDLSNPDNQK